MSPELSSYEEAQLRRAGVDLRDREAVEEHIFWLESILDEVRWPIDDDGYLMSLDGDDTCRTCRADCSAANPPVVDCPMERRS